MDTPVAFGLRLGPAEAVDRAQYFMDWTPDGLKGEYHQKDYAVMEIGNLSAWLPSKG